MVRRTAGSPAGINLDAYLQWRVNTAEKYEVARYETATSLWRAIDEAARRADVLGRLEAALYLLQ
jgi:hypothetical protein